MNRIALAVVATMIGVGASGCYHHSFVVGSGGNVNAEPKHSEWDSHWLFGIIGEKDVEIKSICPSGNATIKDYHSFVNGLIGAFIGFIWYPTTVEVYCDGGAKAAQVTLTADQLRALGTSTRVLDTVRTVDGRQAEQLTRASGVYQASSK